MAAEDHTWGRAVEHLATCYGAARVDKPNEQGVRRVVGLRPDATGVGYKAAARWMVREDGTVEGAWDPDRLLDTYQPRSTRMLTGPEDVVDALRELRKLCEDTGEDFGRLVRASRKDSTQ